MNLAKHAPLRLVLAAVVVVATTSLCANGGGVQPGLNGIPGNATTQLPSCSQCHGNAAPTPTRANPPIVDVTVAKHALQPGETISVTTAVTGGVPGTAGGFLMEAGAGGFTATASTTVLTNSSSISHVNASNRSWTYSYTAPSTVGLVQLNAVGMTADANFGTTGDQISFAGFDGNATVPTPVRLFVLPTGVANLGNGCADGFGNTSVLGATSVPAVGNTSFAFRLEGAAPQQWSIAWAGVNPPGFTSVSLGVMGLTGCTAYLQNIVASWTAPTSAGNAQRAEGAATLPLPIPNTPALQGQQFQVQAGYVDPSVATFRSMPLSFSNGLRVTIQ